MHLGLDGSLPFIFLKSMVIGVSVAAPVGPIGILCIKRNLKSGFWSGVSGGIGTALADAFYAAVAAFSITYIIHFIVAFEKPIRLVGGVILLGLAWKIYTSKASENNEIAKYSIVGNITSTFCLTLANPTTILTFLALFAGSGIASNKSAFDAWSITGGIFAGSMLWWVILSGGISLFHPKALLDKIVWVNRFAGVLVAIFGAWAFFGGLF